MPVSMEPIAFEGWPNCLKLTNGGLELVVTTDVGPRIVHCALAGHPNLMGLFPDMLGQTGGDAWRIYGGHRFWHAPEADPRSYHPDNTPIEYAWDGARLKLIQPVESTTGMQKELEVTLEASRNRVTVLHRLINRNLWMVETAPWGLSVMAKRCRAVYPQEPYRPHPEYLLPARPLVLWHYTDLSDPRILIGPRYMQLKQDPAATTKQKFGLLNRQGWAACILDGQTLVKTYPCVEGAAYPDYGCNTETYTDADMLEVETLGPLTAMAPQGGTAEHVETWSVFEASPGESEDALDRELLPLVEQAREN